MKHLKTLSLKKKRVFIIVVVSAVVLAIGTVIAYSHDRSMFANKFTTLGYRTISTETFDSPSNWLTCETVEKEITVKNESDIPVAVRLKLSESWVDSSNNPLPLISESSGLTMAQINYAENSGWTRHGDYLYYDNDLGVGATTTTPIAGVTLNCDANLGASDPSDSVYGNAHYTLRVAAQTIQADAKEAAWRMLYDEVVAQENHLDYEIDFSKSAYANYGPSMENGNGVNKYTENGQDVWYYRGQIDGNHVIWGNMCWRIARTTYTGGVKLLYNGDYTEVDVDGEMKKQCLTTNDNAYITVNVNGVDKSTAAFGVGDYYYPGYVGYMYGPPHSPYEYYSGQDSYANYYLPTGMVFGHDVSYDSSTGIYTLAETMTVSDYDAQNSALKYWYHYTCASTETSCRNVKYLTSITKQGHAQGLSFIDEENIEDINARLFENEHDSNAKMIIESWFEQKNLDGHLPNTRNYEDDLEDAIFCNDRSGGTIAFRGKGEEAGMTVGTFNAQNRISLYSGNTYNPTLDCLTKRDSFTKYETATTNGKLKHKIGLPTADEALLAGIKSAANDNYFTSRGSWTATPYKAGDYSYMFTHSSDLHSVAEDNTNEYFRPMVSLKAGTHYIDGDGTKTNPYIVE